MKGLFLGDGHITDRKSVSRTDTNYLETLLNKLNQVYDLYVEHNCDYILQVGDFFNSYSTSDFVEAEIIDFFLSKTDFDLPMFCVWGQHDVSGHSKTTFKNSPLRVLEAAGIVKILGPEGCLVGLSVLYGAPFGEKIPKIVDESRHNILVVHQMVGDKELFPGQSIMSPMNMLRRHPQFDVIVCGDYHYRFVEELDGRYCVNPGCLVRKTICKQDLAHEPGVIIFDIKNVDDPVKICKLNVKPINDVFDLSKKSVEKKENSTLLKFLENLKRSEGVKIGWKELLLKAYEEEKVKKSVKDVVEECMVEVGGKK